MSEDGKILGPTGEVVQRRHSLRSHIRRFKRPITVLIAAIGVAGTLAANINNIRKFLVDLEDTANTAPRSYTNPEKVDEESAQSHPSSHIAPSSNNTEDLENDTKLTEPNAGTRNPEIDRVIQLLNEEVTRGRKGLLTAHAAVLFQYPNLRSFFDSAYNKARAAQKVIDSYRKNGPKDQAEWFYYLMAHDDLQSARDLYTHALKETIIERKPTLERLLGGMLDSVLEENVRIAINQSAELQAFYILERQILLQEEQIDSGTMPTIVWPETISREIRSSVQGFLEDAVDKRSSQDLKVMLSRVLRDVEFASTEILSAIKDNQSLLTKYRSGAITEMRVITRAEADQNSILRLQQETIRQKIALQQIYSVWKIAEGEE